VEVMRVDVAGDRGCLDLADISNTDPNGTTLLLEAISHGMQASVWLLIASRAAAIASPR